MDFGALPPEINSARMYSGPGSGPLLAAATGWDGLAAELTSAAASYVAVISRMTALSWHGPASASMAAAAAPYTAWMNSAAAQAEQAANQVTRALDYRNRPRGARRGKPSRQLLDDTAPEIRLWLNAKPRCPRRFGGSGLEADEFAAKNVELAGRLLPDELQDLFGLRSHSDRYGRRRPLCGINDVLRGAFGSQATCLASR